MGSTNAGLGQFLKVGAAALEINFVNLLSSSAVNSRYAIKGLTSGSGRNTKDNAYKTHHNGYILEVCIPPYISTALNSITVKVV